MGSNATDPLIFPIAHYIGEQYNSETRSSTFDLRGGWQRANEADEHAQQSKAPVRTFADRVFPG